MEKYITDMMTQAQGCRCGNQHNLIPIEKILVCNEVLKEAAAYMTHKSYKHAVLIADENTYQAAGVTLTKYVAQENIGITICLIQPNEIQDVVADEKSLIQALLEIPKETEVILAVGSGTIHDISRFCSYKMSIPFISIPTAPSVDGFTSMGAPLIINGVKKTFQTTSPIAVFADLEVLMNSPKEMIAAGFGDMLAKYTSLVDWKFDHFVTGEPYCPIVAEITRDALNSCVEYVDKIAKVEEDGVKVLVDALIKSGLAMLMFGQSHPASGGEHHISHYWEMEFLKQKRPAVLHGAKVAISTAILADLYQNELLKVLNNIEDIREDTNIMERIRENLDDIIAIYQVIPKSSMLEEWIEKIGGRTRPEQLGIEEELVKLSLTKAHHLRDRFTGLTFLNEVVKAEHVSSNINEMRIES
jgi:glycerol-1-phosphate dehydrogenase [NAD(P)+]